ncbi:MAG: ATP-binding protein [Jiangellaceae bacterium]
MIGRPRHLRLLGLRARVTLAFGLVAGALAVVVAASVWFLVTGLVTDRRERVTLAQATENAERVDSALAAVALAPDDLVRSLGSATGSISLVWYDGSWHSGDPSVDGQDLPAAVRAGILRGDVVQRQTRLDGTLRLVVGMPLQSVDGAYAEIFPLDDMERTFRTLSATLVVVGVVAPGLGLLLGMWASRRALRPLRQVTAAAGAVAAGDLGVRLAVTDDPDLAPIAASFNRTTAALQHRVQSDLRFASNVSHELRTPVTTLLNTVQHLRHRRAQLDVSGREALDLLADEVERFERLVDDLLEISRTEGGDGHLALVDTNAAELTRRCLPDRVQHVLEIDPAATSLVVRVDRRRLERTLANLVQNAERHGGRLVRVTVRAEPGPVVCIAVEDDGPGVPAALKDQVFERFARAGGTRETTEGVGLGLALAAQHVRLHHGRIWIEDRPGGGARFVVELPARSPP